MRRAMAAILALTAFAPAGCFLFRTDAPSIRQMLTRSSEEPPGPDVVYMDIAVVQTSIGDRAVNHDVWTAADEQILPSATRLRLQEHGLRVGLVTGRSDSLLELLTSKRTNPNAVQSRRKVGNPAPIGMTRELPALEFPLGDGEASRTMKFANAACQFQVVPTLEGDKVRLQFTPQIDYDDAEKWNRIDPKLALPVQGKRSTESLLSLRFEVSLGLDEYIVVGTRLDKRGSLGFQMFVSADEDRPQQRLVAVRAGRFLTGAGNGAAPNAPLARQAAVK